MDPVDLKSMFGRSHSGRALAVAFALACAVCVATVPVARAADTSPLASGSEQILSTQLAAYAGPLGPYSDGVWNSQNTTCWACDNGGPASAAAVLYELTAQSRPDLLQEAEQTIDTAIATRQALDGSFQAPPNSGDGQGPGISTMFFGVEFATAYHELRHILDPVRRARWQHSLVAAADYLIATKVLTWYTNGNINLGMAEFFWLAYQATGDSALLQAYNTEWNFTMSPPQSVWPGAGLVIAKTPTRADGSDGAGYLAEIGVGGTGFDAEYSSLQLDVASRLYLLSGDPRALRLANLLVNMLLPRVDSNWFLGTSGGTRHPDAERKVEFLTSAPAVLSIDGGRHDLAPLALSQLGAEASFYAEWWEAYNPVFRRALGNDTAVIALAAANTFGLPNYRTGQAARGSAATRRTNVTHRGAPGSHRHRRAHTKRRHYKRRGH